jgi:probable phosphoglycerate mutase
MTTYLLRHASTTYSTRYLVNGDPSVGLRLDPNGVAACERLRDTGSLSGSRTWITSEFPRARQTAGLLINATGTEPRSDPRLNELDYGVFEGSPFLDYATWLGVHGPWVRPQGSAESQREGIARMLTGVQAALTRPGPRVVVAHGLLLSVLGWAVREASDSPMPLFFPEAACLDPLVLSDARLTRLIARLLADLGQTGHHVEPLGGNRTQSGRGRMFILANFDSLPTPPEERPPHA